MIVQDVIKDLSKFLQIPEKLTNSICKYGQKLVCREWEIRCPETEDEITNFYQSSFCYLFDLAAFHKTNHYADIIQYVFNFDRDVKILDFGAGIGTLCLWLEMAGFKNIYYYDLHSIVEEFAKWRFKKYKSRVKIADFEGIKEASFEVIILIDVLEHLPDIEVYLQMLSKLLCQGGYIYATHYFPQNEANLKTFPMHLERYLGWGSKDIEEIAKKVGLKTTQKSAHLMLLRKEG